MSIERLISSPISTLEAYLKAGGDPDLADTDGATLLFHAILAAKESHVWALIQHGGNVNHKINEHLPAAEVLAPTPLSLAQQCAFLLSKKRYTPIVQALLEAGAVDET